MAQPKNPVQRKVAPGSSPGPKQVKMGVFTPPKATWGTFGSTKGNIMPATPGPVGEGTDKGKTALGPVGVD